MLIQMQAQSLAWWQVIAGVLTIPVTLLGLVYTFRLHQKTKLEIYELKLRILERERALGLADDVPFVTGIHGESLTRWWRFLYAPASGALPNLLVLLVMTFIPRPNLLPIPLGVRYGAAVITAVLAILLQGSLRRRRQERDYVNLTSAAVLSILVSALAVFVFLFTTAVWVIRLPSGDGHMISVVISNDLTSRGHELLQQPPYLTYAQALEAVEFQPKALWHGRTWTGRMVLITFSYNLALLAVFGAIASLIHLKRLRADLPLRADETESHARAG